MKVEIPKQRDGWSWRKQVIQWAKFLAFNDNVHPGIILTLFHFYIFTLWTQKVNLGKQSRYWYILYYVFMCVCMCTYNIPITRADTQHSHVCMHTHTHIHSYLHIGVFHHSGLLMETDIDRGVREQEKKEKELKHTVNRRSLVYSNSLTFVL